MKPVFYNNLSMDVNTAEKKEKKKKSLHLSDDVGVDTAE